MHSVPGTSGISPASRGQHKGSPDADFPASAGRAEATESDCEPQDAGKLSVSSAASTCCLVPPSFIARCFLPRWLVGGCVTGWDSEIDLQVTSELTLPVPCECQPACWLLLTVFVQVDILLLPPWREGQFNSCFISSFDFLRKQAGT